MKATSKALSAALIAASVGMTAMIGMATSADAYYYNNFRYRYYYGGGYYNYRYNHNYYRYRYNNRYYNHRSYYNGRYHYW